MASVPSVAFCRRRTHISKCFNQSSSVVEDSLRCFSNASRMTTSGSCASRSGSPLVSFASHSEPNENSHHLLFSPVPSSTKLQNRKRTTIVVCHFMTHHTNTCYVVCTVAGPPFSLVLGFGELWAKKVPGCVVCSGLLLPLPFDLGFLLTSGRITIHVHISDSNAYMNECIAGSKQTKTGTNNHQVVGKDTNRNWFICTVLICPV